MATTLDPVEQEIALVRQKLLNTGADSFTDLDWQFLRTYWLGTKLEGLTKIMCEHVTANGHTAVPNRRQAAMKMAVPGVTGMGMLAVVLEILRALQ